MGTTENVDDRKWNNCEVINTLRKFTEESIFPLHLETITRYNMFPNEGVFICIEE